MCGLTTRTRGEQTSLANRTRPGPTPWSQRRTPPNSRSALCQPSISLTSEPISALVGMPGTRTSVSRGAPRRSRRDLAQGAEQHQAEPRGKNHPARSWYKTTSGSGPPAFFESVGASFEMGLEHTPDELQQIFSVTDGHRAENFVTPMFQQAHHADPDLKSPRRNRAAASSTPTHPTGSAPAPSTAQETVGSRTNGKGGPRMEDGPSITHERRDPGRPAAVLGQTRGPHTPRHGALSALSGSALRREVVRLAAVVQAFSTVLLAVADRPTDASTTPARAPTRGNDGRPRQIGGASLQVCRINYTGLCLSLRG